MLKTWYIKIKNNADLTWKKLPGFFSQEWLNLKTYIEDVVNSMTITPSSHTHTISDITSLQTQLDAKVDENSAIVGATKTKVTYDAKGLVTAGTDATTADIADSTNKRYVTDAQLTIITNTSGINTGDQTSIVGVSGTKSQFNTACSDGDFVYTADIGSSVQAHDADLDSWAGVTRASGVDTFIATPSSANLRSMLTDENGTGEALFSGATSPTFVGTTAMASATLSGTVTNYSGIATVNNGIPFSAAKTNLTGQTAAIGYTTIYTTPAADGFYLICWTASVTTAATSSSKLGPITIRTTNAADNVVKTWPSGNTNNINQTSTNATGTGIISGVCTAYCKASTNIQYAIGYTSSGATPMAFSADITVLKL